MSDIIITGARQHNLKNVNVRIPRDSLTVVTGLSGSGKSSLAFDTLYAEGQTDFLNVLTAERSLYVSQDALVQSERVVATDLIAVYKALGGGLI